MPTPTTPDTNASQTTDRLRQAAEETPRHLATLREPAEGFDPIEHLVAETVLEIATAAHRLGEPAREIAALYRGAGARLAEIAAANPERFATVRKALGDDVADALLGVGRGEIGPGAVIDLLAKEAA